MVSTRKKPKSAARSLSGSVEAHLDALRHPERPLIDALRELIAGAVPRASEEIKWHAPSFAKSEHFATLNLRAKRGVQLILHLGAKVRVDLDMRSVVTEDAGLLDWKGPDRAIVALADLAHLKTNAATLKRLVAAWAGAIE